MYRYEAHAEEKRWFVLHLFFQVMLTAIMILKNVPPFEFFSENQWP